MDAIEAKIEAIKALFVPFDLVVEIRIGTNTVINNDGSLNKSYDCQAVCVDEFDEILVRFIANEHTKKLNSKNNVVFAEVSAGHLKDALEELQKLCVDAIERKYDAVGRDNKYSDDEDDDCDFLDVNS